MALTAATATAAQDDGNGTLWLILFGTALVAWYVFACFFWPFRACPWCSGSGRWKEPGQSKKKKRPTFRACWICKGTGKRLRLGRRVMNFGVRHGRNSRRSK